MYNRTINPPKPTIHDYINKAIERIMVICGTLAAIWFFAILILGSGLNKGF